MYGSGSYRFLNITGRIKDIAEENINSLILRNGITWYQQLGWQDGQERKLIFSSYRQDVVYVCYRSSKFHGVPALNRKGN